MSPLSAEIHAPVTPPRHTLFVTHDRAVHHRPPRRAVARPGAATALTLTAALALPACLAGCQTTEGVGEDIEAAGEAIDETAEDVADDV